jgi:hypothetical protein
MKKFILYIIRIYQKTLSPDHSWLKILYPRGYCKYRPTCSDYTYQSINKYGIFKGGYLGVKRVLKCNPFSKGGYDPLK